MPIDLPPIQPSIEIVAASDYVQEGVTLTNGKASYRVRGDLTSGPVFVSVGLANVDVLGADAEAELAAGASGKALGLNLRAQVSYTNYIGSWAGVDADLVEVKAEASRAFGPITAGVAVQYTPDDFGPVSNATYVEARASYAITSGLTVSGGAGKADTSAGDYDTYNFGATQKLPFGMALDVRYHNTNRIVGGFGGDRTVVSLISKF